jgi:hypothetical protein
MTTTFFITTILKMGLIQLDVIKSAFLHGELHEEISMEQAQGFFIYGKETKNCKVLKSLYGLN